MAAKKNDIPKSPIQRQYKNARRFCTFIAAVQLIVQAGLFVYLFGLTGRMEQNAITAHGAMVRGGVALLTLFVIIGIHRLAEKQQQSIKQVIDRSELRRQQQALKTACTPSDFLS